MKNIEIRRWYTAEYQNDEAGKHIKPGVTFNDVYQAKLRNEDIKEVLGVSDAVVLNRVINTMIWACGIVNTLHQDKQYIFLR